MQRNGASAIKRLRERQYRMEKSNSVAFEIEAGKERRGKSSGVHRRTDVVEIPRHRELFGATPATRRRRSLDNAHRNARAREHECRSESVRT